MVNYPGAESVRTDGVQVQIDKGKSTVVVSSPSRLFKLITITEVWKINVVVVVDLYINTLKSYRTAFAHLSFEWLHFRMSSIYSNSGMLKTCFEA